MKHSTSIRVIDLFCGAGGMTLGFTRLSGLPFESVWANDFNSAAAETFNVNFSPVCHPGDIVSLLESDLISIPRADLVIGGPPCQGFSLLNKKREDDPRKKLWIPFMEIIDRSGARAFVMENVPQLLNSLEHAEIVEWAHLRGFQIWSGVLLAADYGVPQTRRRAFLVGSLGTDPELFFPPPRTHHEPGIEWNELPFDRARYAPSAEKWKTVRDAISDLPPPKGIEPNAAPPPMDLHFGRSPTEKSMARYRAIPHEGMNRFDLQRLAPELTPDCWIRKKSGGTDLFGRLWWDRPAFTIRTEFYKPEKGRYLHPEQHRPITHREAARFQSFPDDFQFQGSKIEIARQIGNAVPPALSSAIAKQVYAMLSAENEERVDPQLKVAAKAVPQAARR